MNADTVWRVTCPTPSPAMLKAANSVQTMHAVAMHYSPEYRAVYRTKENPNGEARR